MSKTLIDRIRKARQSQVKSGERTFTIRRPTNFEMMELRESGAVKQSEIVSRFVVDWGDITEQDLVPGGTADKVPFSQELFAEWVADHPEHWKDITEAIVAAYSEHERKFEDLTKN